MYIMKQQGDIMYLIIDTTNNSKHREPSRPSWKGYEYKSVGAAKAGITRTVKFYQEAFEQVAECVANGEPEYMARMHNAYRDATEAHFGRVHKQFASTYKVIAVADYSEPMVTTTGTCPYNGKEMTRTIELSQVGTHMDPLCESHYTR